DRADADFHFLVPLGSRGLHHAVPQRTHIRADPEAAGQAEGNQGERKRYSQSQPHTVPTGVRSRRREEAELPGPGRLVRLETLKRRHRDSSFSMSVYLRLPWLLEPHFFSIACPIFLSGSILNRSPMTAIFS